VNPVLYLPTLTQTIQHVILILAWIEIPAECYVRVKVHNLRNLCEARVSIHQNSHKKNVIPQPLFWTRNTKKNALMISIIFVLNVA